MKLKELLPEDVYPNKSNNFEVKGDMADGPIIFKGRGKSSGTLKIPADTAVVKELKRWCDDFINQ